MNDGIPKAIVITALSTPTTPAPSERQHDRDRQR